MNKRVAVWKKTRRFQNLWTKMKKFRSQELSLASALLVLVSFTLKEQIIDYLKDQSGGIDRVVALLERDAKQGEAADRFGALGDRIDESLSIHFADGKITPKGEDLTQLELRTINTLRWTEEAISKLDNPSSYQADLQELKSAMKVLDKQVDELPKKNESPATLQTNSKILRLSLGTEYGDAFMLRGQVWSALLEHKEKLEQRATIAKWCVYALFILGWSLGLVLSRGGEKPKIEGE